MAPEIIKHQPYDLSIDIYSFGILLWQMCNLKIPFEEYTNIEGFNAAIISNKRPNFTRKQKKLVPTKLQELIISCWQPNVSIEFQIVLFLLFMFSNSMILLTLIIISIYNLSFKPLIITCFTIS